MKKSVRKRIIIANRYAILKYYHCSNKNYVLENRTCCFVQSSALYARETWATVKLDVFKRKLSRKVFGPIKTDFETNEKSISSYGVADMIGVMESSRSEKILGNATGWKLKRMNSKRPRRRWSDRIQRGLRTAQGAVNSKEISMDGRGEMK